MRFAHVGFSLHMHRAVIGLVGICSLQRIILIGQILLADTAVWHIVILLGFQRQQRHRNHHAQPHHGKEFQIVVSFAQLLQPIAACKRKEKGRHQQQPPRKLDIARQASSQHIDPLPREHGGCRQRKTDAQRHAGEHRLFHFSSFRRTHGRKHSRQRRQQQRRTNFKRSVLEAFVMNRFTQAACRGKQQLCGGNCVIRIPAHHHSRRHAASVIDNQRHKRKRAQPGTAKNGQHHASKPLFPNQFREQRQAEDQRRRGNQQRGNHVALINRRSGQRQTRPLTFIPHADFPQHQRKQRHKRHGQRLADGAPRIQIRQPIGRQRIEYGSDISTPVIFQQPPRANEHRSRSQHIDARQKNLHRILDRRSQQNHACRQIQKQFRIIHRCHRAKSPVHVCAEPNRELAASQTVGQIPQPLKMKRHIVADIQVFLQTGR